MGLVVPNEMWRYEKFNAELITINFQSSARLRTFSTLVENHRKNLRLSLITTGKLNIGSKRIYYFLQISLIKW